MINVAREKHMHRLTRPTLPLVGFTACGHQTTFLWSISPPDPCSLMPSTDHPSSYFAEKSEVVREFSHALYFVFPPTLASGSKNKQTCLFFCCKKTIGQNCRGGSSRLLEKTERIKGWDLMSSNQQRLWGAAVMWISRSLFLPRWSSSHLLRPYLKELRELSIYPKEWNSVKETV